MGNNTILYRGSIKSCNYRCSYCPFSKHASSRRELEKDKEQWLLFCASLEERASRLKLSQVMVAPYGEALIHPWYWEGLAHISAIPTVELAGAQTNLSFPVKQSLEAFCRAGGTPEKLCFWATFHPEMTSPEKFVQSVYEIAETGIPLCAGAVGMPENLELIRRLRQLLPEEVYLWINKMDGLGRVYTQEEQAAFEAIDPYFVRELCHVPADVTQCQGRLFVEADGRMRTCNIGPFLEGNWYELGDAETLPEPVCRRKQCSCYLAYGGRNDMINHLLFDPYPLFRIPPRQAKAAFLDIDGTLVPQGASLVPAFTQAGLRALSLAGTFLFFATSLPYETALKRCDGIRSLFCGGVFSGGAHVRLELEGQTREQFFPVEPSCIPALKKATSDFRFRLLTYEKDDILYKLTLVRPKGLTWTQQEAESLWNRLPASCRSKLRFYIEGHCLEIVAAQADKAQGVLLICKWLGIPPQEIIAVGDSEEDEGMMRLGRSLF